MTREVDLVRHRVEMAMFACATGGNTFAVGGVTLADVRDVGTVLIALRQAAASNVGASPVEAKAIQVPGMTPQLEATQVVLNGKRPDGTPVQEHLAVFARGARVYQAAVVGERPDVDAVSTFFGGLKAGF